MSLSARQSSRTHQPQKSWTHGSINIDVAHDASLPVYAPPNGGVEGRLTILFGTQISDASGVPSGPWTEIEYDPASGLLKIARDPAGLMAAFFAKVPDGYLISDSVPMLLQFPQVSRDIDLEALNQYWFLDYCIPPRTIWRSISAVPNGHRAELSIKAGKPPIHEQFYCPSANASIDPLSTDDAPKVLRQVILDVTERSLAAHDGQWVNLLSGGVDSSVVFAACNVLGRKPDLAITFKGEGDADESDLAAMTAKRFGVPLEIISSEGSDIVGDTRQLVQTWGQPYAHGSVTAMQGMLRQLPAGAALLTGDGGGEAFAWKPMQNTAPLRWHGEQLDRLLHKLPDTWHLSAYRAMAARSHYGRAFFYWLELAASAANEYELLLNNGPITTIESKLAFKKSLAAWATKEAVKNELQRISNLSRLDGDSIYAKTLLFSYAPEGVYAKTWRLLGNSSIEGFAPLTSPAFLGAVKRILPVERGTRKQSLREAFGDVLPSEVLNAPKRGLTPINRRLLQESAKDGVPWMESKSGTAWDEIFDRNVLARMWQVHADGNVYRSNLVYKAIVFRCWADVWKPELRIPTEGEQEMAGVVA